MIFTADCSDTETKRLKDALDNADTVIIGAGAGLSTSAGFTYSGERFDRYFRDFAGKYGFTDMYSGGFYPFESLEEHWAYWSRYIYINRYMDAPKPVYDRLLELVQDKDYFVLTTNVDHCFQKAGFDKERIFYTQGDYGLFQCSRPCHSRTYDNKDTVMQMLISQGYEIAEDGCLSMPSDADCSRDDNGSVNAAHAEHLPFKPKMLIPSELVPRCPVCGRPMTMNLRCDSTFVEDDGWEAASARYSSFLRNNTGRKVLFLELGVGFNTPGIIKYPFWRMTSENKRAVYACLNYTDAYAPAEIRKQSICIEGDIGEILSKL